MEWDCQLGHGNTTSIFSRTNPVSALFFGVRKLVVAERFPEAARLEEITLHIYDQQGRAVEIDRQFLRLCVDRDPRQDTPLRSVVGAKGARKGPINFDVGAATFGRVRSCFLAWHAAFLVSIDRTPASGPAASAISRPSTS